MNKQTPTRLTIETLTPQAFAPFGEVIQIDDSREHFTINDGYAERYHDLARIDAGEGGHAIVSLFRGKPRALPITISMMERHPRGSQAFVPLSGHPYLVVVAAADSTPAVANLRAFRCEGHQGVNYARGVWHHPLLALDGVSDFLVIDRAGPGDNCDVVDLGETAVLE